MSEKSNHIEVNPILENLDKIPKILYKYRTFDKDGFGLKMAASGEVYFASGSEFNDPFECYFIPKSKLIEYDGEKLIAYLKSKASLHYPDTSEQEIEQFVQAGIEQHKKLRSGDPSAMDAVMETQYKNFGILALTDNPFSIPMWAYYSDSFTGFCVGFHTEKVGEHQIKLVKQKQALILRKVNYQEDILEYNVDVDSSGQTEEDLNETEVLYFTKSDHWQHESEYRLIFSDFVSKPYSFGVESVAEVIIGLRTEDKKMEELINGLRSSGSKAKLKRLVRSQSKFELLYEEINY